MDDALLWVAAGLTAVIFWYRCRATGGNPWLGQTEKEKARLAGKKPRA